MSDKLITFGTQENQDQISRIEAMNADEKQVVSIFEQIMELKDVVIHDCFRLRKLVNEKNRPVVVKIENAWTFRTIFLSVSKLRESGFVVKKFLSVEDYKKERTLYQRKKNLINNFGYEKQSLKVKSYFIREKLSLKILTLIVYNRLQIKTSIRPDYQPSKSRP